MQIDRSEYSVDGPTRVVGRYYAIKCASLADQVRALNTTWHELLLQASVVSMWEEKTTLPVFIAYAPGNTVKLFVITRQRTFLGKVHEIFSELPGYIESGDDAAETYSLRVIAYWDPLSSGERFGHWTCIGGLQ